MHKNKNKIKYNGGAAMMILVIFFVFISLTILIGIVTPTVREFRIAGDNFKSKQTYFLAESGIEDVLYRLKNGKQTGNSETLILGESQTISTITDITGNKKEISSLADTDSIQRKVGIIIDTGVGAAFSYGIQAGVGGFSMDNNSEIIGSVYSNGPISGSGLISGSATSANSSGLVSDQSNRSESPTYSITFGKENSIGSQQDCAQSFKISKTEIINKVDLYLYKVGNPPNLTVKIVNDSNGSPSTTVLTSASLSASLISTNYGWVEVPFSSNPELQMNTTYWIVIDSDSYSSSNYYGIAANINGYIDGVGKVGKLGSSWSNTNPSGLDAYFNLYIGGVTGSITGVTVGTGVVGNTYAHTVTNATIRGTNYCQTGSGNNKTCNTSREDPVQIAMPISEQNILDWKDAAVLGGTITGDKNVSSNTTIGPKKITGNLTLSGNGTTLTMSGTIWVVGNLILGNNTIMKLGSGYGTSEGVIIVDGTITISNNAIFQKSDAGGYMMALTTSSSSSAINLANNSGSVALYAANGTIEVANNGTAISLTGYRIHLSNGAIITYEEGLANANFISGPSGTWNVESWREVE